MSTNSNDQGRAYEYAWMNSLYTKLNSIRKTKIIDNSSLEANKRAWLTVSENMQKIFKISASSAIDTILELEPLMSDSIDDELLLEFQQDGAGIKGDVRDIVIKRNDIQWEVGLSIKHNHEAIKHSRLSYKIDFGNEWFGLPCSKDYWDTIMPIFNRLKGEKKLGTNWSDIHGSAFYCKKLLERINKEMPDRIILVGDILYHGPRNDLPKDYNPKEVIKMLNELTTPIVSVRGNCDSEVDQMVLKFPILADYLLLAIGKKTIFVTHGHLYNKNNLPPLNKGDILLCGHTHVQCFEEINDIVYMNCGSVSIPKEDGYHGYMIIEDNNITWKDLDGNVHLNKVM